MHSIKNNPNVCFCPIKAEAKFPRFAGLLTDSQFSHILVKCNSSVTWTIEEDKGKDSCSFRMNKDLNSKTKCGTVVVIDINTN